MALPGCGGKLNNNSEIFRNAYRCSHDRFMTTQICQVFCMSLPCNNFRHFKESLSFFSRGRLFFWILINLDVYYRLDRQMACLWDISENSISPPIVSLHLMFKEFSGIFILICILNGFSFPKLSIGKIKARYCFANVEWSFPPTVVTPLNCIWMRSNNFRPCSQPCSLRDIKDSNFSVSILPALFNLLMP